MAKETQEKQPELFTSKFVTYIGQAHIREIDAAGWADSDVKDDKKFVWNKKNGWAIPVDQFTDNQMTYFEGDPEFVIKDVQVPRAD